MVDDDEEGKLVVFGRWNGLRLWCIEFVVLCLYFFIVMFNNSIFALLYFDNSLFSMKPNVLLIILSLVEMEELMKVGAQLSFTFTYLSINLIFLIICQL